MPDAAPAQGPDRETLLVVDDDARNRAVLEGYLSPHFRILEADHGSAALEVLGHQPVDLVILDVMMPQMSGFEVCRRIKATQRPDFLPVLLLTALDAQEDRNTGLEAGADDFLTKPFDRRELLLRVRAFLRIRRQEAVIRRQVDELRSLQSLKDDLFSLIVHDLRNPLSGVLGYLQLLKLNVKDTAPAGFERQLTGALNSARMLQDLVNDLLEVRLLEEGQLKLNREATPVSALAAQAVAALEGAAQARLITVNLAAEGEPTLTLDRKLIRRSIENLLGNALKYSSEGGEVTVGVRAEGTGVAIDVADRGPGVPDPMKADVFEKFVTVEGRTGKARRGYGLGLHLVKLVAGAHGGSVSVRDREGGGAVFRLLLPGDGVAAAPAGVGVPTR